MPSEFKPTGLGSARFACRRECCEAAQPFYWKDRVRSRFCDQCPVSRVRQQAISGCRQRAPTSRPPTSVRARNDKRLARLIRELLSAFDKVGKVDPPWRSVDLITLPDHELEESDRRFEAMLVELRAWKERLEREEQPRTR